MDISKARIAGPCTVVFNGVNMGHTLDGIMFSNERSFADVFVDKYGTTSIDKVLTGQKVFLRFKLAQPDWRQYNLAIPETSSYDGAGTADRVDLGADAGTSLRQDAAPLVIHPMKNAATNYVDDITLYLAVSVENIEVPYNNEDQQAIEVTMEAFVSEAYGSGRRLGHIGPADVS